MLILAHKTHSLCIKMNKYRIYSLLLFIVAILIVSCVSFHQKFNYYKESVRIVGSSSIRTDGIYFIYKKSFSHAPTQYLIFYTDGKVYVNFYHVIDENKFWLNPSKNTDTIENKFGNSYLYNETWGHYIIRGDSLNIQFFHRNNGSWIIRNITKYFCIIQNNSTLAIYREEWTKDAGYYNVTELNYNPSVKYKFFQTSFKPDSSKTWFNTRKWYNKY